jgi:hypothetical protein
METQTMVERPSILKLKNSKYDRILAIRLDVCFGQGINWDASSPFGLLAWPLEASHYGCPSREVVGLHGQRFGLWTWSLEASHYARPKAPISIFYWLFLAHFFGLSTKSDH